MVVVPVPTRKQLDSDIITRTGELPLELIRMKAKGCTVTLHSNDPGFTLPSNIGELGDDITVLDLRCCSLQGACAECPDIPPQKPIATEANLKDLQ